MAEKQEFVDRRHFLLKSAYFFAGTLLGLNSFRKAFATEKPSPEPSIALIIDDIGFSHSRARRFMSLGVPITFSILPRLPRSVSLAKEVHSHGHEIMLHQPMEPVSPNIDPGPGALYVGDGRERISEIMEENISEIPYVLGVNNHMGSRFTSCESEMSDALSVVRDKGLFFIDSLTTNRSTGYHMAKMFHMPAARRNTFLDIVPKEEAILGQLHRLKIRALRYGHAIGIGHPYPVTAWALQCFIPDLERSGISLVNVSTMIRT